MNQLIRSTLTSTILAAMCLAATAYAEPVQWSLKAHIPFEFKVGDQRFPAGDYFVREASPNYLALGNRQGQILASVFTNEVRSSTAPAKPVLRFNSEGGQLTLAEVWRPENSPYGQQVSPAKARPAKRHNVDTAAIIGGPRS
jgi:hypothetical protein